MKAGANLLEFGKALNAEMEKVTGSLPVGVGVHLVADQPRVVEDAIGHFTRSLFEAVVIVLVVSFIALGMRAGLIVALAIPLVLAMTFLAMGNLGITLQRVSLGALIIALGLLVDDAMIAIEMMIARLEKGDTLRQAALQVYTSTTFPRLTGTLVIIAGFVPIGLNSSSAGEYTFTLFAVLAIALLLSWLVAGIFILGVIALIGILIRNSVILVVQIETLRKEGAAAWDAVVRACEERVRPIMLTAAAASLGLVPIARDVFWGPMAYAMMGGIIVGTALTLLFLPALYVAWFRVKEPAAIATVHEDVPVAGAVPHEA
jgi:multidrug efflux pump subunit AcrB